MLGPGLNFYRADLKGANLAGANLAGANLDHAYLREADLAGANLREANLTALFGKPDSIPIEYQLVPASCGSEGRYDIIPA